MKTGQIILIAGAAVAFYYRNKLGAFVGKKVEQVEEKAQEYLGKKLDLRPKGFPRVSADLKRGAVNLKGSIELTNRTPFAATLDRYQIDLVLDHNGNQLNLGKTPIEYPGVKVMANSKQTINYVFSIKLTNIASLLQTKNLQGSKLSLNINNLKVSGFETKSIKIDISKTWNDITAIVKNPASLITNLFKF